jgi:peptidoglycan-associated lipoprotein
MHKFLLSLSAIAILGGCAVGGGTVTKEDRKLIYATGQAVQKAPAPTSASPVAAVVAPAQPAATREAIVYFDFDKYEVKQMYLADLERVAKQLATGQGGRALVEGHTDTQGSTEYNLGLGQRRAEAVRKVLESLGAQAGSVEAISYGKERLAAEGKDDASHAKNRRAEILIVKP